MSTLLLAAATQTITFLPLALGISISYRVLRATDMTLDGSFVLGAGIFAKCIILGFSAYFAAFFALIAGAMAGMMVSLIQRHGKIEPLLAGILASFILTSGNLILMGRPNINLLNATTLVSSAFATSETFGWLQMSGYCFLFCFIGYFIMQTRLGLRLRAFGSNPLLVKRLGYSLEKHRTFGFALTNLLAAASGMLTAQIVGYADIGMGLGMTLTGIGAIILGQQLMQYFFALNQIRILGECLTCLVGVFIYFLTINGLLRFDMNPIYLRLFLGVLLIIFLRAGNKKGEFA